MHLPVTDRHFAVYPSGTYQRKTIEAAIKHTPGQKLAIDVGAHVGYWSGVLVGAFDEVYSIEPVRENFDCLVKNVPTAKHINAACGENHKRLKMVNPATNGNSGAWESRDGDEVDCITIDSLLLDPDLIKIDVQGYERNVLAGALETINRCKPVLCVEVVVNGVEHEGLVEFIKSLGYKVAESVRKDRIFVPC